VYYVEYLRASRALIIGTIVIAVAFAINIAIYFGGGVSVPDKPFVIPFMVVWATAAVAASIFASILGRSLAKENDGHLPVAWTKPVPKSTHAAMKMAVDVAAIAILFAIMSVAAYAYISIAGMMKFISVPSDTGLQLIRFALAPLAFYGLVQCLTASVGKRSGTVLGLMWVGVFVLSALGSAPLPQPYHSIFAFIDYANPLVYINVDIDKGGSVITAGLGAATLGLALIAAFGAVGAVFQWQRLEAS
jgi:hypothetical protein